METRKSCSKCGYEISEQTWGQNPKTGKPYHAWRHVERNEDCDFIDWISDKSFKRPNQGNLISKRGNPEEAYSNLLTANRELYILIKAFAYLQGITPRDLKDEITKIKEKNELE